MHMKTIIPNLILCLVLCAGMTSAETVQSGDSGSTYLLAGNKYESGKTIRRTLRFEGMGGVMESEEMAGDMSIDFSSFQIVDEYGAVLKEGKKVSTHYALQEEHSVTHWGIGGQLSESSINSPLEGFEVDADYDGSTWVYSLSNGTPTPNQSEALQEILFNIKGELPVNEMAVGSTWSQSPLFVNAYIRRDVSNVRGSVTATFLKVESIDGEQCAIIGIGLESSGDEIHENGTVSIARIILEGTISLSLETFLQKSVDLKGQMSGGLLDDGKMNIYTTPITLSGFEEFVGSDG